MFDTLKARHRTAHAGAEPDIARVLSFGVASAFCGQVRLDASMLSRALLPTGRTLVLQISPRGRGSCSQLLACGAVFCYLNAVQLQHMT
jgi:hypothetical protein